MDKSLKSRLSRHNADQLSSLEHVGFDSNRARKKLPPLQTLVAFEASARLKSFTLAAKELNLTQPAISQQVKLLEQQLGVQLFKRSNNNIALSEPGETFAETISDMLKTVGQSVELLSAEDSRSLLTLSLLPSFASTWFSGRMRSFVDRNPDVDLIVLSTVAKTDFDKEGADVAIRWGPGGYAQIYEEMLVEEHQFLAACPQIANEIPEGTALSDLTHHTMVHDTDFTEWRNIVELNNANPSRFEKGLYFGDASASMNAIANGAGIGVVRDVLAIDMLESGALVRLPFEGAKSPFSYHFLCPEHRLEQPRVQKLLNWLRDEISDMKLNF